MISASPCAGSPGPRHARTDAAARMHSVLFGAALMVAAGTSATFSTGTHAQQVRQPGTESMGQRLAPCMSCHGKEGRAASDGYYPRIAGKPAGYLYNQLINFRDGRRQQYPLMGYMVQHLSDEYLLQMANYFADQHLPYPPPQPSTASPAALERGRTLALNGDSAKNIPACIACHGQALTGVQPALPGLLGLPRDYINAQFGAWREGARRAAAPDCMGQIARQLSVDDIAAASAWLSAQPVPANALPVAALPGKLPLPCGGVGQ